MTLAHDHNGNLTDDGIFLYVYDAWNRLRKVTRRVEPTVSTSLVAEYKYDGLFRRIEKDVTNSGYGVVHKSDDLDGDGTSDATGIQAGERTEHYYYAGWSLVETRNGSGYTLGQWVWGTQYIGEPVAYDRNTNLPSGGSGDNDCLDSGGSQRYTYHQDANFRVVALTDENAAVAERYDYTAYGEPTSLGGVGVSPAESGNVLLVSGVGNPFMHQGLFRDEESGTYQNRFRQLHSRTGRFMQRDPLELVDGPNIYEALASGAYSYVDPFGLKLRVTGTGRSGPPAQGGQKKKLCDLLKKLCPNVECDLDTGEVCIKEAPNSQPASGSSAACKRIQKLIDSNLQYGIGYGPAVDKWEEDIKGRMEPQSQRSLGKYDPLHRIINLAPDEKNKIRVKTKDGKVLSYGPKEIHLVLAHELTHAFRDDEGRNKTAPIVRNGRLPSKELRGTEEAENISETNEIFR